VPLPYAHKGIRLDQTSDATAWFTSQDGSLSSGAILYDPDSADDIDDDDPDEDLDI
jgi:elongator complex protein 5